MTYLLTLGRTTQGEDLYLYPAVFEVVVSSILVRDEHDQVPMYYVSKALHKAELKYPPLEKLALTLMVTASRLRSYFEAHLIVVLTNQPLRAIIQKPKVLNRMVK